MKRDKYNMIDELEEKDRELAGDISLLGATALTDIGHVNAMRGVMFTSHLKQFTNLIEPEFPYVFTNAENTVGKFSSGYKKMKNTSTVFGKAMKFAGFGHQSYFGVVFFKDEQNKKFTMIERKEFENLTEIYGYQINNTVLDSLEVGDTVEKGTVVCKSTSYDDTMNYSYGINVPFMYCLDAQTTEDAAVISESLAKRLVSPMIKTVKVPLNDNHYLLNLYGDDTHYKPFPSIGERVVDNIILAKRTLINNQVLSDFKSSSLQKINYASDEQIHGEGIVADISVYCNNEDIKRNSFNSEILDMFEAETQYYEDILRICDEMQEYCDNEGYTMHPDIIHLMTRARTYLNREYKWKEGDGVFSNIVMTITVIEMVPAQIGQKITGRYGNKSVISEIRPDYLMPHRDDGQVIHLLLNELAIINRTTSAPLFENSITFICERIQQHAATLKTRRDKENIIFDVMKMLNAKQEASMHASYNAMSSAEKDDFIDSCINDHIYIHIQPLSTEQNLFLAIREVYAKYGDILKPYDIYVYKFGRWIKSFQPVYAGQQYIMKLKQTSEKGFIARNTGEVNMEGLPEKSHAHKNGTAEVSGNTVRFGEFETYEFKVAMPSHDIAEFFTMYRSSVKGRRDLAASLLEEPGKVKLDKSYSSRVNEIFDVFLKSLGIRINFMDDNMTIDEYDDNIVSEHHIDKETYICTDWEFWKIKTRHDIEKEILNARSIIDNDELQAEVERRMNQLISIE